MSRTSKDLVAASAAWTPPERSNFIDQVTARALRRGASCRWCGSTNTCLLQQDVSRYGDTCFDVWECLDCTSRFTDFAPLPAVDYNGIAARHAWYKLHDCDAQHVAAILDQGPEHFWTFLAARYVADIPWFPDRRYRACLAAIIDAHRDGRPLRILEIGCGRGIIGAIAARLGHTYLGLDVISEEQSHALERFRRFGAVYRSIDPDSHDGSAETFDLVFSSEVIEHVDRPLEFLRRAIAQLDHKGRLIVTTPDLDTCREHVWNTDRPPIHTVFLCREAIERGVQAIDIPGSLRIHNENGAFDWRGLVAKDDVPAPALQPIAPIQLKPDLPDFAYAVENVAFGTPRLDVVETPDLLAHDYQAQMIRAAIDNARLYGGSMIVSFIRGGLATHD